jgi:hypothetical protein
MSTNKLSVMNNGTSNALYKNTFLLKSLTKQNLKIKIITYLCFIKHYNTISCSGTYVLLLYMYICTYQAMDE